MKTFTTLAHAGRSFRSLFDLRAERGEVESGNAATEWRWQAAEELARQTGFPACRLRAFLYRRECVPLKAR